MQELPPKMCLFSRLSSDTAKVLNLYSLTKFNFSWSVFSFVFQRKDSYNEHLLIHIGPRHRCPHCSKEFVQRSNMIRHIRIHTGNYLTRYLFFVANFSPLYLNTRRLCMMSQKQRNFLVAFV